MAHTSSFETAFSPIDRADIELPAAFFPASERFSTVVSWTRFDPENHDPESRILIKSTKNPAERSVHL